MSWAFPSNHPRSAILSGDVVIDTKIKPLLVPLGEWLQKNKERNHGVYTSSESSWNWKVQVFAQVSGRPILLEFSRLGWLCMSISFSSSLQNFSCISCVIDQRITQFCYGDWFSSVYKIVSFNLLVTFTEIHWEKYIYMMYACTGVSCMNRIYVLNHNYSSFLLLVPWLWGNNVWSHGHGKFCGTMMVLIKQDIASKWYEDWCYCGNFKIIEFTYIIFWNG